ncbi:MAG: adenylyltransferase/cytidyltransferase family protein [Anaplasmataceae bacterium]|nr:adenylyltransferase/cytidyltransferase family protein [Anaplasmataceae bacterium]
MDSLHIANPTKKIVKDLELLAKVIEGLKAIDRKIVVTIGSWDLLHIGHVRYLLQAKQHGDILIAGTDSDRVVKMYKGDLRPIVPEEERCEMLSYQSCVDFVTLVDDVNDNGEWQYELIKVIRPHVFIAEETSYSDKQLKDVKTFCKELIVLPRQAQNTSTTKMVQNAVKKHLDMMYTLFDKKT